MKRLFFIILLFASFISIHAQNETKVKGRVIDKETKEALIGVAVKLQSAPAVGTATDVDGYFEITVPSANSPLVISYVGYSQVVTDAVNGMVIEMVSSMHDLNEIVVVGYGTMRKSDLTGSVSSVKGNELSKLSSPNVAAALAGRSAGVQVTTSGSVDGNVKVRVRGIGTINNSNPLYVVDGFPTSDISYIAPTDIESMEVLKDASASAIYGSRGANGVIMITTKRGVAQPTRINFNTYFGVRSANKYLDVLDAKEYALARKEAYSNDNIAMDPNQLAVLDYALDNNLSGTDWQKEVLRNASVQNYNLSVTGGSKDARYNLSTTYNSEEGILKNSFVDKFFIKLNTEYKLYSNTTFGADLAFVNYNMSNTDLSNIYSSALTLAARAAPVSPVFDQFGNWENTMAMDHNPVRINDMEKYKKRKGNKFIGNFFLNLDILKNLSFRTSFGADYTFINNSNYYPEYFVSQQEQNSLSSLEETRNKNFNWVWSNVATYNHSFNDTHKLTAMVGTEATYSQYDGITATGYDVMENTDMRYLSAAKSNNFLATSTQGKSTIFSTFLRMNYAYANRYLVTATIRSDASSRFSKDKRVGYFPSVSLGWNVKEESFLQGVKAMDQLKVRAGWGQVGNQSSTGIGDYLSKISNGQKYVLGGTVYEGRIPTALSNPDLKWEIAEQYNLGLDFSFLNGKIVANMDYFIKNTKDMIVRAPIPNYVGADEPLDNVGNMRNRGFEFTVNHYNKIGEVNYNVGLNLSFINNKVTSLGRAGAIHATVYDQRLPNTSRTEVGREIAYYYGYKTDGIFNTQEELDAYTYTDANGVTKPIQPNAKLGDVKYRDLDGDGKIDESDLTYLGSYMPDFSGGFNLGAEYKNFTFSLFADFVYGNKIANMTTYDLKSPLADKNILKSYYNNRWTKDTPENNEPRLTTTDAYKENTLFSDRYIENGSFLRIRNIQLGYNLPFNIIQKVRMQKARVYVSVDNLATFTKYKGYNPEIGDQWGNVLAAGADVGGTPLPRTFSLGFNIEF